MDDRSKLKGGRGVDHMNCDTRQDLKVNKSNVKTVKVTRSRCHATCLQQKRHNRRQSAYSERKIKQQP